MVGSGGSLFAGLGLPGSGKSSLFKCLARKCNAIVFNEPEEDEWPQAVHDRDICGRFTAITWFRAMRVPKLYEADVLRKKDKNVFVDSYYDKLLFYWLGKPGMEWLIGKDDPYYDLVEHMAKRDLQTLPDADAIVLFKVSYDDWKKMLSMRSRRLDRDPEFLKSFDTQQYFIEASESYSKDKNIPLIVFEQSLIGVDKAARKLHNQLLYTGLI